MNSDRLELLRETAKLLGSDENSDTKTLGWAAGATGAWNADAARETADQPSENAMIASAKTSPAFGLAASRLAMRMHGSGTVPSELAIRWLKAINTAAPDILAAWSDRANLHLKEKQFQQAIECYEFLIAKLPGNKQVMEALEGARKLL